MKAAWLLLGLLVGGASPALAAFTTRTGHTATLLADGSVLIVGGSATTSFGGGIVSAANVQIDRYGTVSNAPQTMPNPAGDGAADIARSSHTATLLPDGNVLVAGGISAGGVVRTSLIVWQRQTATWATVTGAMSVGRYNHTATLLHTGAVLICGGVTVANPTGVVGDVTKTCDLYRPNGVLGCGTAGGCVSAAASMAAPRSLHTAVLVPDGRVFITGGWDPAAADFNIPSEAPVLVTSELYTPAALPGFGAGTFAAAHNLIAQRYNHTATLLGNGKVLIAGGFNGRNVGNNFGVLSSAELYDPIADSMIPAGTMNERRESFSVALDAAGTLTTYGGLGNVTTTFLNVGTTRTPTSACPNGALLSAASNITGATLAVNKILVTGGLLKCSADFQLKPDNPTGVVEDGFIMFSSPAIVNQFYQAWFPNGTMGPLPAADFGACGGFICNDDSGNLNANSTFAYLQGSAVFCSAADGSCGHISRDITIIPTNDSAVVAPPNGTVTFFPLTTSSQGGTASGGNINFNPSPVNNTLVASPITSAGSSINFPVDIKGLPANYIGSTFGAGSVFKVSFADMPHVVGGTQMADVSLTAAAGSFAGTIDLSGQSITADLTAPPFGEVAFNGTINNLVGTVVGSSITNVNSPINPTGDKISAMTGVMFYNLPSFKVAGESFDSDVATVTIRSMFFSDQTQFDPLTNSWAITEQLNDRGGHKAVADFSRMSGKAVLLPTGSQAFYGGQTCNTAGYVGSSNEVCPSRVVSPFRDGISVKLGVWQVQAPRLSTPRLNHTATAMPDGTVLIAGGSNGPNVLNSVDVYDPVANSITAARPMGYTRDLHSATLLPNGRVLVAGGYSTTGSTGSTNSAEIYYPAQRAWVQTANLNTARDDHAAVLMADGNVMVIGGISNGAYLSSTEIFYTTSTTWGLLKPMNTPRALFSTALLQNGKIMVAGGVNASGVLSSVEIYDPVTNTWSFADDMRDSFAAKIPLHSQRAIMLADGRVLITGGNDGFGETRTSLIFDPNASAGNQWTTTATQLNTPRFSHGAVLLPSGAVAVVGGAQSLGQSLSSVETFEVYSASWQITGTKFLPALTTPRSFQTTLLTSNGFLLAIGGSNNGTPLDTIESIYFEGFPDARTVGAPPSIRQSSITLVDFPAFDHVSTITLSGVAFKGMTEASSGGGNNASYHNPRITLQQLEPSGGSASQGSASFLLDLSTRIYTTLNSVTGRLYNTDDNGATGNGSWNIVDSSISIAMPSDPFPSAANGNATGGNLVPYGWYQLRVSANSLFSNAYSIHAGPFLPQQGSGPVAPIPVVGQAPLLVAITSNTVYWQWTCAQPGVPYCPINPGVNGFDVFSTTSGVFLSTVSFSTNVYTQTGMAPNTQTSIMVAPFNLSGDGPLTTSATVFTLSTAPITSATSISSVTFASLVFSWNVNNNLPTTVYEVSESTDNPSPGGNGQQPFSTSNLLIAPTLLNLTTNFFLVTGLQANNTYFFRVRAMNGDGLFSNYSAIVSTATGTGVSQPTGTAQNTTSILWTWPDAFLSAPSHYNVYNATSGLRLAVLAQAPTYLETSLSTNTQNSIRVSAVTSVGEGQLSPSASAYTLAAVPSVSGGITSVSTGSLIVAWGANQNPLGTIYNAIINNASPLDAGIGPNVSTVVTAGFSTGFGNLGLSAAPGVSPPASVLAVNIFSVNGDGIKSGPLSYGTTSLLAATPGPITFIGATPNSIALSWTTAGNVSTATYEVTYTTDNFVHVSTALPYSALSNVTSLNVPNLLTGTTYQFRVRSFDIFGTWNGSYSISAATGTPNGGAPPGALSGLVDPTQNVTIVGTLAGGRPVSLFIPAHSFPSVVFVTLSTVSATACSPVPTLGLQISVNPPLEPIHPAYLTMGYTAADVAFISNLAQAAIERVDPTTGRCVPLSTNIDQANSDFIAEINHFSLFQIAQVIPPTTVESTLIFPNPFMATEGDGYVTFSQVPTNAHIRIFTLHGALVNDGYANASGIWIWGGTNYAGRPVASGIYIIAVESGKEKKLFKLVVLR